MQPYPVYTITANGPAETGVSVEMRLQLEAGGGLSGAPSVDEVAQVVASALAGVGATSVSISKTSLSTAPVATV